jgi:anti-anti-sigma factor
LPESTLPFALVRLAGELDLSSRAAIDDAIRAHQTAGSNVVVDLGDVTFLDVAIASVLVRAAGRARAQTRGLVLLVPFSAAAGVRRLLLELIPAEVPLPIVPTYEAAIRALAGAAWQQVGSVPGLTTLSITERMLRARADAWRNCARTLELLALRDELLVDMRDSLARCRSQLRPTH